MIITTLNEAIICQYIGIHVFFLFAASMGDDFMFQLANQGQLIYLTKLFLSLKKIKLLDAECLSMFF